MTAVVLGLLAGGAVLRLLLRRPPVRRDPGAGAAAPDRSQRGVARRPGRRAPRPGSPDDPIPDLVACIDLLGVATGSGQTVGAAVRSVGAVGSGPLARELDRIRGELDRGAALADRLEDLGDRLGPAVRPLVAALLVALRSGDGAAPALHRLADAERRRLRRRREARLRRLPVLLTVPLVLFVLPAFVVLTLLPVALSVAGDLPDPATSVLPPTTVPVRRPS